MLIQNFKKVEFKQFWPKNKQLIRKSKGKTSISIVTAFFDLDRALWGKGKLKSINTRHVRTNVLLQVDILFINKTEALNAGLINKKHWSFSYL